jgi:pantoate kinase
VVVQGGLGDVLADADGQDQLVSRKTVSFPLLTIEPIWVLGALTGRDLQVTNHQGRLKPND